MPAYAPDFRLDGYKAVTNSASGAFRGINLLRAVDVQATTPFRVLLEDIDTETWPYALREGGFATWEAATAWWEPHWCCEVTALPLWPPVQDSRWRRTHCHVPVRLADGCGSCPWNAKYTVHHRARLPLHFRLPKPANLRTLLWKPRSKGDGIAR